MLQGKSISLVIPCYNEAQGLAELLPRVPACVDEVVVADNNSVDGSAQVALGLGAKVVPAPIQGYGAAYKAGFAAATGDIIVTADGDGTYPVELIGDLVGEFLQRDLQFVSARRFPLAEPRNMPLLNRVGNWGLTLACAILFGGRLKDSQSGMWVFWREDLERLRLQSDGMSLSEEIKIEALLRGLRFAEIHIPYHMRIGEKKLHPLRDGLYNLWFLLRLRLRPRR